MKVSKCHAIHQLTFLPRAFPVNCYIVEEETDLTLVDAALPYSAKAILSFAKKLGKPVSRIVLTHAHGDHIGALDTLKKQFPEMSVYISERDARLLAGDRTLDRNEPSTPIRGGVPKPGAIKTRPDVLLREGDRVGSLLVIETPGHTPGSISLLDERTKFLLAGDAFQTRGGFAVAGQLRLRFPFPAMATWNHSVALESAKKAARYEPAYLGVGHGKMIKRPLPLIERATATSKGE